MSEKKDQPPKSPSQESAVIPFKKRDFSEAMSSDSIYDDIIVPMNKKTKLDELQRRAYFAVLHAFSAESPAISSPRIMIMKDLMKEWNISHKTHSVFQDKLKTDLLVKRLRNVLVASDEKAKQKVTAVEGQPLKLRMTVNKKDLLEFQERLNVAPATIQDEKAKPTSTSEDSLVPSWGQVCPKSLVDRCLSIRMPGEEEYVALHIKEYNAETEMHHLVTALSQKTFSDPCDWIDLRHIPEEDIIWQNGHPGIPTRKCFLKPGETILYTTSTAQQKKRITEVGKTASGIPIIRKLDKGKSIA